MLLMMMIIMMIDGYGDNKHYLRGNDSRI